MGRDVALRLLEIFCELANHEVMILKKLGYDFSRSLGKFCVASFSIAYVPPSYPPFGHIFQRKGITYY